MTDTTVSRSQPAPADRVPPLAPVWLALAVPVLAGASWLGMVLHPTDPVPAILWPANGLALALMVLAPTRQWLTVLATYAAALAIASVGNEWSNGPSLRETVAWYLVGGFANLLEVALGAVLLRRTVQDGAPLARTHSVLAFVLGPVLVATAIAAALAALAIATLTREPFLATWQVWWFGDATGILIVTPVAISIGAWLRREPRTFASGNGTPLEAAALILSTLVIGFFTFHSDKSPPRTLIEFPYLVVPFVIWGGLRFDRRIVAVVTLLVAGLLVWGTHEARGPFVTGDIPNVHEVLAVQTFLATLSIGGFLITSLAAERRVALRALERDRDDLAVAVDETTRELDRSEARFQRIVEGLREEVFFFAAGPDRRFSYLSPSVEKITGFPPDRVVGKPYESFFTDHLMNELAVERANAAFEGQPSPPTECEVIPKNSDQELVLRIETRPVFDDRGRVVSVEGIAWDVTKLRRAEEQLSATNENLEARVLERTEELLSAKKEEEKLRDELHHAWKLRALGTLASGVAHDFNNLVTAVLGHSEIVEAHLDGSPEARSSLEGIRKASEQATSITESLLTFSRRRQTEKVPQHVAGIVRDAVEILRPLTPALMRIEVDIPEAAEELWIRADRAQVQQVLLNLAVNARDAMDGAGRLRIALEASGATASEAPALGFADIVVEDEGPGIPEDQRERVLDPFFTTKPREQGTGLGLAIVNGVVSEHGGRVSIESAEPHGARIRARFPRCEPDASAADAPTGAGTPDPSRPNATILIVEDHEQIRLVLASMLGRAGYDVVVAADGEEGIEKIRTLGEKLRVAVFDLDLPGRSGIECLAHVRAESPWVEVVLITASFDELPEKVEEPVPTLLHKPFPPQALLGEIERCLARGSSDEEAPS